MTGQVSPNGVDDRGEGDGDQGAEDAGGQGTDRDDKDDGERVDPYEPSHQERLQHMALDLLHRDHAAEHDQRRDGADRDQGDGDSGDATHGGTDDRDERAQEDEDRQGRDEGEAEDPRDQAMPIASVAAMTTVPRT